MFWNTNSNTISGMKKRVYKLQGKIYKRRDLSELVRVMAWTELKAVFEIACDAKEGRRSKEDALSEIVQRQAEVRGYFALSKISSSEFSLRESNFNMIIDWLR